MPQPYTYKSHQWMYSCRTINGCVHEVCAHLLTHNINVACLQFPQASFDADAQALRMIAHVVGVDHIRIASSLETSSILHTVSESTLADQSGKSSLPS